MAHPCDYQRGRYHSDPLRKAISMSDYKAHDTNNEESRDVFIPVEQDIVPFYDRDLVAVRLADGRICAALRWLCEGLHLDTSAQVRRIQRKTALVEGLLSVALTPRVARRSCRH